MADYGKSIFLFRRDLRISDNTGLIEASQASKTVVPLFIFDPRQGARNPYFSPNAFQFMIESLEDLAQTGRKATAEAQNDRRSHDLQALASADAKRRTL